MDVEDLNFSVKENLQKKNNSKPTKTDLIYSNLLHGRLLVINLP